jgi:glycosyltransferase involved in cell wall biosynthesis
MPHITLFTYSLRGGGAEKMMVLTANELHQRGHNIELVLVKAKGPYESLVDSDIQTTEIGGNNTFKIQYNLWRHLRQQDTDVLLSTMEIPNIVATIATHYTVSVPVVLRSASIYSKRERSGKYKFIPVLKRFIYPKAEAIVVISDGVGQDLSDETEIDEAEFTTIYNPAYNPKIRKKATKPVENKWLTDDEKRVVIGVGNMKPAKDFATLVRAVRRLQDDEETYLIILGEGPNKNSLLDLATDLNIRNRISFPGFVDNPYAYMSKADVFVLSSAWEGFGNVIVEAMGCGTPVVCTDCPGGPSEILNNGEYGPLVPVGDEEAMATAIHNVLSDPIDSSRLYFRATDFAIEPIVDQYEEILFSVIG